MTGEEFQFTLRRTRTGPSMFCTVMRQATGEVVVAEELPVSLPGVDDLAMWGWVKPGDGWHLRMDRRIHRESYTDNLDLFID